MPTRRRIFRLVASVALVLVVGGVWLGYYVTYVHREQLREWRRIPVLFEDVGGLEVGDAVMVKGSRAGRVGEIRLFEDRQLVILDVEPDLPLYEDGIAVEVVPTGALGYVAIDLQPGDPGSRPLPEGIRLKGRIRPGLGGTGAPGEEIRRELNRTITDLARVTREMQQPDSGPAGYMLFDRDAALAFDEGLSDLDRTWQDVVDGLARVERGEAGSGLLEPAALEAVSDTMAALDRTLGQLRTSLREVVRGEGTAGRWLGQPTLGHDTRRVVLQQGEVWRQTAAGEGSVGRLIRGEDELTAYETVDRFERATGAAVRGEGLVGALGADDAGESARQLLSGLEGGLQRVRHSDALRDETARTNFLDASARLDDTMNDMRRGLRGLRASLPDKTFQGVVFGIF